MTIVAGEADKGTVAMPWQVKLRNWQDVGDLIDGASLVFVRRDCDQRYGGDFGIKSDWRIRETRAPSCAGNDGRCSRRHFVH